MQRAASGGPLLFIGADEVQLAGASFFRIRLVLWATGKTLVALVTAERPLRCLVRQQHSSTCGDFVLRYYTRAYGFWIIPLT